MTDDNKKPRDIFVAVSVGGSWRVMDTRNGKYLADCLLSQCEAVDLALLLNSIVRDTQSDQSDRQA